MQNDLNVSYNFDKLWEKLKELKRKQVEISFDVQKVEQTEQEDTKSSLEEVP